LLEGLDYPIGEWRLGCCRPHFNTKVLTESKELVTGVLTTWVCQNALHRTKVNQPGRVDGFDHGPWVLVRNGNSNREAGEDIDDFEEGLLLRVCNVNRKTRLGVMWDDHAECRPRKRASPAAGYPKLQIVEFQPRPKSGSACLLDTNMTKKTQDPSGKDISTKAQLDHGV
jgi:hypothetical protein